MRRRPLQERSWRSWYLWSLPRPGLAVVLGTDALAVGLLVWAAARDAPGAPVLAVAMTLLGCLAMELSRSLDHQDENGPSHDLFAVWVLPVTLLAGPLEGMLVALILTAYHQWRVAVTLVTRRTFAAATVFVAASAAHTAAGWAELPDALVRGQARALAAVAVSTFVYFAVCGLLTAAALRLAGRVGSLREALGEREALGADLAEACLALLALVAVAVSPFLALLAVPVVAFAQRALALRQAQQAARVDPKTKAASFTHWSEQARIEIARAERGGTPLGVVIADLDHFKRVNDVHGHLAGDRVLVAVARAMMSQVREYDQVGRFGGEEFVVLLPGADADGTVTVAERIRQEVAALLVPNGDAPPLRVTMSFGVTVLADAPGDLDLLLELADKALYEAKTGGRDRVVRWQPVVMA